MMRPDEKEEKPKTTPGENVEKNDPKPPPQTSSGEMLTENFDPSKKRKK